MKTILIIMPAYNEEENIAQVIRDIQRLELPADLLVVNDGSSDRTEEIVKGLGAQVIDMPFNSGYGVACQTGFKYAVEKGYQFVLQMDSDGQHRAEDLVSVMNVLLEEEVDIVIGSRFLSERPYPLCFMKKLAILMFRLTIRWVSHANITDPSSGLQGLNRRTFTYYSKMDNYPEDYPDADVLIRMLLAGFKVKEVPATFMPRTHGSSMHSGLEPVFYMSKMYMSIILIVMGAGVQRRRKR